MLTWDVFLNAPAFVINLDRRPDRWESTKAELIQAGFTNIHRVSAVDASHPDTCQRVYESLGSPMKHPSFNNDFNEYPGTFGCFLSHLSLWKYIIDHEIPYACVFEDDIQFHTHWKTLAPEYLRHTPVEDYDILYLGSQFETHIGIPKAVDSIPVFCTHAYAIPLEGVKRLYAYVLCGLPEKQGGTGGIYTIDILLIEAMKRGVSKCPFRWRVWNTWLYACPLRDSMSSVWRKRNGGMVYQNEVYGTDIREYKQ